jgi:hypothetical protein
MKASTRQATAMLQPNLSINNLIEHDRPSSRRHLYIKNQGTQPIVFLDFTIRCFPHGKKSIVQRKTALDDVILFVAGEYDLNFDFSTELAAIHVQDSSCGYRVLLVVSDLSRQVVIQYEYFPVLGRTQCTLGMPLRVRWKYRVRPWKWRYNRAKGWLKISRQSS